MEKIAFYIVAFLLVTSLSFGQIQNGTVNGWYVADTLNVWEASSRIITSGGATQDTNGDNYQVFRLKVYDSGKPASVDFEKMIPKMETPRGFIWYRSIEIILPKPGTMASYEFAVGDGDNFYHLPGAGNLWNDPPGFLESSGYFQGVLPDSIDRMRLRIFPGPLGDPVRILEFGFDFLRGIKNDEFGTYFLIDSFEDTTIVGIEDESSLPSNFRLFQNYPNPFNPETKIRFELSSKNFIKLQVFDILGRELTTLVNEEKYPGGYEVIFNASNFSSGTYFFRLQTYRYSLVRKMVYLK